MTAADLFASYAAAFRASRDRAHILADPLTEAQANWRPAPGAWSVAECLEHLNVMARAYAPLLDRAVTDAPQRPDVPAPVRLGVVGSLFVRMVRPGSRPMPTAPAMKPPAATGAMSALDLPAVLAEFDGHTEHLLTVVADARDVDAGRVRVRSPFLPLVRMPLAAFLDGLGQHALRHVGQAERVVLQPGFPAA